MTLRGPNPPGRKATLAALVVVSLAVALAAGGAVFAACGGNSCAACNSTCTCPSFDSYTGTGWCPPGPNDCQACKVVICPGYCFGALDLQMPYYCGDAGTQ